MRERFLAAKLHTLFLKCVLFPNLTAVVLVWIGNSVPRPTNYDLIFYALGYPLGVVGFFTSLWWLACLIGAAIPASRTEPGPAAPDPCSPSPAFHLLRRSLEGQTRQAAESTLCACFADNKELATAAVLERVVKRIPWSDGPYSSGSSLRLLKAVGPLAKPFAPELQKHRAGLALQVDKSPVIQDHMVLRMLDEIIDCG